MGDTEWVFNNTTGDFQNIFRIGDGAAVPTSTRSFRCRTQGISPTKLPLKIKEPQWSSHTEKFAPPLAIIEAQVPEAPPETYAQNSKGWVFFLHDHNPNTRGLFRDGVLRAAVLLHLEEHRLPTPDYLLQKQ